jgi:hypothetical protein
VGEEGAQERVPALRVEPGTSEGSWSGAVRPLSFEQDLSEWVRSSGEWLDASLKPEAWDLAQQRRAAGLTPT